ncbi:conserved phage C-terminal domain-containing protein [Lactobacillus acidophilus]|uniref:conserved phage C-terminal domain-containing protein n=1 Tax=Lactobacillus acidophilus TaxID=1579 RepID=UPI003F529398
MIDVKSKQWLTDQKMKQYLRPETLFGTKFESYLNENEVTSKPAMKNGGYGTR